MKKKMEILTELPKKEGVGVNKGKMVFDWKETIGMTIEVEHMDYGNISFKVLDYKNNYLILDYNGYILEDGIYANQFLKGIISNVIGIRRDIKFTDKISILNDSDLIKDAIGYKWEENIGRIIKIMHHKYGEIDLKILDFYKKKATRYIVLDYNGYVYKKGVSLSGFLRGNIDNVLGKTKEYKNEKNKTMTILNDDELIKDANGYAWELNVGKNVDIFSDKYGMISLKIIQHYRKNKSSYIVLDYNGYIYEKGIFVGTFLYGNIGNILGITNNSKNTFHLDKNNVLHIYGENKNGKWEALYSGNHVEEVMNTTWGEGVKSIKTQNYNRTGKRKNLHGVDFDVSYIDHISNQYNLKEKWYDNRYENLRISNPKDNARNKKSIGKYEYTGLCKAYKGWNSQFRYKNHTISTKVNKSFDESIIDNLIAQRYLGRLHNEEDFYKLDGLSNERIKEVENWLMLKLMSIDNKKIEVKNYNYDIIYENDYKVLFKNGQKMILDSNVNVETLYLNPYEDGGIRWQCGYIDIENNKKIITPFHRYVFNLHPGEYEKVNICIDHVNGNPSDNRLDNLLITTNYGNFCNVRGNGYNLTGNGTYKVNYMCNYKYITLFPSFLINNVKVPTFKTEQEAIQEVERRKVIINNARVKLKSKQELDELIQYCLDSDYTQDNGLADLDLGYLYWKGILKTTKTA